VIGQPVVDVVQAVGIELLEGLARRLVQALAPALQQGLIDRLLGEGVLEQVARLLAVGSS